MCKSVKQSAMNLTMLSEALPAPPVGYILESVMVLCLPSDTKPPSFL